MMVFLCFSLSLGAQNKTNLKILYVGETAKPEINSNDKKNIIGAEVVYEKNSDGSLMRKDDFMNYLKSYFTTVDFVEGKSFKEEMSKGYDVTVFDAVIPAKKNSSFSYDFFGNKTYYDRMGLSEDFNYPSLFIASTVVTNTRSLGTKMDWL